LDVGCATGYSSAVLAGLAAAVVAVEEDAELAAQATALLDELEWANAAVVEGPLAAGVPDQGPYDLIFVNGAVEDVPPALLDQLAEGGRLACVFMAGGFGRASVFVKANGAIGRRELFDASVPPLPGFGKKRGFVF
ncbi:MAG: methyltransferase domain-containing protein, partial [Sphingomonadales bacterium]